MAFWDKWIKPKQEDVLVEAIKSFKNKGESAQSDKQIQSTRGEGRSFEEFTSDLGFGKESMGSFTNFYQKYIDNQFKDGLARLNYYRTMAEMPEIASVVEDIVIESTQENEEGQVISLEITDPEIEKNENISNTLAEEFDHLFFNKIGINNFVFDVFRTYFVDGRVFIEKIINKNKAKLGIIGLKKLPTETMDYFTDPRTGRITGFIQYLKPNAKRFTSWEEAEKEEDKGEIVLFYPEQIMFLDYGIYGRSKKEVIGYLEKAKQPFNQLKLLETSVIIYRIVKAPERLVFRIDTGAMPRDKAMKFVDKIKRKFTQKVGYNAQTGKLENQPEVISMLDNYFIPTCLRLNTKINCLDGNDKQLSQIIEEFNNGIKNEVLSVDQKTGKIIRGEVEWAGITRKNAELVRVYFDNDEYVDVTPDHRFVMRDGTEKEAQDLQHNDSIMPYYTRKTKICTNSNTYNQVFDLETNTWKFIHRIDNKVKKGNVIHHKDFNRYNNMSDNLVEMKSKDHFELHSKQSSDNLKKMWKNSEYREKIVNTAKKTANRKWSNKKNREEQSQRMKDTWKKNYDVMYKNISSPKSENHKKKLSDSIHQKWKDDDYRYRVTKGIKESCNTKEYKEHASKIRSTIIDDKCISLFTNLYIQNKDVSIPSFVSILSNDKCFMNHWKFINKNRPGVSTDKFSRNALYNIINYMGYNDYTDFKQNVVINHKVLKVETLNFREDTGCLTIKDAGDNHNFALSIGVFVKNSSDGRGSDITSVGGNPTGFAELDDIYYFARKLYMALKYPMSRIMNQQEGRYDQNLWMQGQTAEISRDEIRWSKFLERHQNKFEQVFLDLFLLHLEYKGIKSEHELDRSKISLWMVPPNNYKDQMRQMLLETRMNNYNSLSTNQEFAKSFLMKEYLGWDDEMIKANSEGHKKDEELFPKDEF